MCEYPNSKELNKPAANREKKNGMVFEMPNVFYAATIVTKKN